MTWRIEIRLKEGVFDALGEGVQKSIVDLGIPDVTQVSVVPVYTIDGDIDKNAAAVIARDLLCDPVTQEFCLSSELSAPRTPPGSTAIEIAHNPGVMDPVEASTLIGVTDLGFSGVTSVRTSKIYILEGTLSAQQRQLIVDKVLANKLIQHVVDYGAKKPARKPAKPDADAPVAVIFVDLLKADKKALRRLSAEGQLYLNDNEMAAIKKHFQAVGRNPTDCELETIAQTWSEHCYHKTFRGNIQYDDYSTGRKRVKRINNLLKSTIAKATFKLNKPWCVSVFHDNAGVIKFDADSHVCFKVETHNHPSALEPYGGANTGLGGVIRDILGTGLGAKPVCSTDVFCFAPPDTPFDDLPPGTLHPKRVMKGVVSGVRDYGNKMGIPTVNGAVLFDKRYLGNPLVYCGNIGIMPKDKVFKKPRKGDLIVAMGGRTGRDGIHGATFSSGELTGESEVVSSGAVQIGDPIQEKKVLDALLRCRDENLYTAVTDCGAGGFSSAVGEMGEALGARVQLKDVPLKYEGLNYEEIWISESQERMVLSVPPEKIERLKEICRNENVEATVIGEFSGTKRLEIFYGDVQVCDLDMTFLHDGHPRTTKKAVWKKPRLKPAALPKTTDLNIALVNALAHYNVCSKEWVIRQYDHEVQGGSIVKPLTGIKNDGPSDASVVAPKAGSRKAIAVSNGINPRYGMIDPYWMAASCIDEAIRQIIAVGGTLDRIAILDNFCWGNPDKPDRLGSLVRCAEGCYKAAVAFGVPFISGKDSLYNEYTQGKSSIAIPGTLLISAIGIVDDKGKCVTMDLKDEGNLIYSVGETHDELGGSIFLDNLGQLGDTVPQVRFAKAVKIFRAMEKAAAGRLIRSAHDCSEGGLAVALAEMAFSSPFGVSVDVREVPYRGKDKRDERILFSESNSRFVIEVKKKDRARVEKIFQGLPLRLIGEVTHQPYYTVRGLNGEEIVNLPLKILKEAWQKPLGW